jgi:hypothetical protein
VVIDPDAVRDLPAGSVVISSTWAALRLPTTPQRYRFWQVTGALARKSDTEMVRFVAQAQRDGDSLVSIARVGSEVPGVGPDELSAITAEVSDVLEEQVIHVIYGLAPAASRIVEMRARAHFHESHPNLARLLTALQP